MDTVFLDLKRPRRPRLWAIGLLAGLAFANSSHAISPPPTTFTLWEGGTANLTTGLSYTNTFDGNLLFTPGVDHIDNATLTLNFVGSSAKQAVSNTRVTEADGHNFNYVKSYTDDLDSAAVLLNKKGGQTRLVSDVANAFTESTVTSSTGILVEDCHIFVGCTSYVDHYERDVDRVTGYKGAFSVEIVLDAASLAAFESTGLLRYGFTVNSGGLALDSALLSFSATAVPEPSSASLVLAGLGSLLAFRRGRRSAPMG
jgi:hypothetical protein